MPESDRRAKYRAQLRVDALGAGLAQIEASGLHELSVASVAKELGMRAPSLYYYFASREDLIAQIVLHAAEDLTDHMRTAFNESRDRSAPAAMRHVANTSRDWCLAAPNRFRMVFGGVGGVPAARAEEIARANALGLAYMVAVVATVDQSTTSGRLGRRERRSADFIGRVFADGPEVLNGVPGHKLVRGYRVATFFVGLISLEVGQKFEAHGFDHQQLWEDELEQIVADLSSGDPTP